MKYTLFKTLILFLMIFSCGPTKSNQIEIVNNQKDENLEKPANQYSTKPFDILVFSKSQKKIFHLSDSKKMNITIINFGVRDFLAPEWFDVSYGKASELYIELFKIVDKEFKEHQSSIYRNIHSVNPETRTINTIKNGDKLCFKNIDIDMFKPIQDTGKYYAKIHIDLSDYGYFKKLESDVFFEVVSDSIKINPNKNTDLEEDEIYLKLYSKKKKNIATPIKDSIN